MPNTPLLGLPYPSLADDPDVPRDIRALALAIEDSAVSIHSGDFKFSFQTVDHGSWFLCDGAPRDRTLFHADALTVLDATLGAHPDPTKVRIPDMRRRSPMGANAGSPPIWDGSALIIPEVGALSGEEAHRLSALESGTNNNGRAGNAGNHNHGGDTGDLNLSHLYQGGGLWFSASAYSGVGSYIALGTAHHHSISYSGEHDHPLVARSADFGHNTIHPVLFANWFIWGGASSVTSGGGGSGGGGSSFDPDTPLDYFTLHDGTAGTDWRVTVQDNGDGTATLSVDPAP